MTKSGTTAHVSVVIRIAKARHEFFKRTEGDRPNTLYIGHEDFYELLSECSRGDFDRAENGYTYMGMQMLRVDIPHHVNVVKL